MKFTGFFVAILSALTFAHLITKLFGFARLSYISLIVLFLIILLIVNLRNKIKLDDIRKVGFNINLVILAAVWTIVYLLIGDFNATPADFLLHLNHIKYALIELEHRDSWRFTGDWFSAKGNYYGYMYYAFLAWIADVRPYDLYAFWSWLNPLLLFIAVFEFSKFIYKSFFHDELISTYSSFISVLSLPLLLGVDSFSYIRAYASSAAISGFIIFIYSCFLLIKIFDHFKLNGTLNYRLFVYLLTCTFIQFLIHPQEAIFTFLMTLSISASYFFTSLSKIKFFDSRYEWGWLFLIGVSFLGLLLISGLIASILLPLDIVNDLNLFNINFLWCDFYIANVAHLFSRVVELEFVLLIIFVFLVSWKIWRRNDFLSALIFAFLLIFINPIFVHGISYYYSPDILYRFTFLFQPHLLFGIFFGIVLNCIRTHSVRLKVSIPVFSFVFGIIFYSFNIHNPRMNSLVPLAASETVAHWSDLWIFMDGLQEFKLVYTDPITGYMVNGLSRQHFEGYKFHGGANYVPLIVENFDNVNYDIRRGGYLIVNLRDGGGEFVENAGHWPSDVLILSKFYSLEFLNFIDGNAKKFNPVWKSDDGLLSVYEIL